MLRIVPILTVVILAACSLATGENFLANPGFEKVVRGMPVGWHVFVEPMEGAEGRLDEQVAGEGACSVRLHNPEPYEKEPANNWSQNIIADLGGKELEVSGSIRTDEATEAAIWLQCFSKRPFGVLRAATTSTDSPVYGTTDWTPVKMKVAVPEGTDFVVLRCVLKGSGTAWFDDIEVGEPAEEPAEDKQAESADKRQDGADAEQFDGQEDLDDMFELLAELPDWNSAETGLDADVKAQLLEAHRAMVDTNLTLRDMNVILMDQVLSLRDELTALKQELGRIRTAAGLQASETGSEAAPNGTPSADAGASKKPAAPPLVPHGANWEDLVR